MVKLSLTKERLLLGAVLVFATITRLYRLALPRKYYFDEVYHAFTASAYATGDPRGYEWWHSSPVEGTAYEWLHPPIAKLFQGFSIWIFGDTSFFWRLPSVIFGLLLIGAVWWFAKRLWQDELVASLAALLVSLDGLLLVQSRITMNDVFVVFFMIMAMGFYYQSRHPSPKKSTLDARRSTLSLLLAGLFSGLALATKWSGVFVIGLVGIWEFLSIFSGGLRLSRKHFLLAARRLLKLVFIFGFLPLTIYFFSYTQFWLQGHTLEQFKQLHNQIWWYQNNLDATHPYQSVPAQWVFNLRPVWYHWEANAGFASNIYALANPIIAWGGLVGLVWMFYLALIKRQSQALYLFLSYVVVFAPWVVSPRIMFFYHYLPAIPLLAIALAKLLVDMGRKSQIGLITASIIVGLTIAVFVYFYPIWTGLPLPETWVPQYFWFESWK